MLVVIEMAKRRIKIGHWLVVLCCIAFLARCWASYCMGWNTSTKVSFDRQGISGKRGTRWQGRRC